MWLRFHCALTIGVVVENMEEIDQEALDRVAELEKIVKAKEAAVKKLRESVGVIVVVVVSSFRY